MNKNDLLHLISHPEEITSGQLEKIQQIAGQYPYFQTVHFLIARYYAYHKLPEVADKLKTASAYSSNRAVLKKLISEAVKSSEESIKKETPKQFEEQNISQSTAKGFIPPLTDSSELEPLSSLEIKIKETKLGEVKFGSTQAKESELLNEVSNNLVNLKSLRTRLFNTALIIPEDKQEIPEENVDEAVIEETKVTEEIKIIEEEIKAPEVKGEEILPTPPPADETATQPKESIAEADRESGDKSSTLLNYLKRIRSGRGSESDESKKKQDELIEKFIKTDPSLKIDKKEMPARQEDLSKPSISIDENLVSENLAIILIKQGKVDKAIDIYKKLIWKYPQKKAYFADRIKDLKKE